MASSLPSKDEILIEEKNENEVVRSFRRYKELFSTFPKEKGWIFENLYQYQGFWYHLRHGIGVMAVQEHFKAKQSDILLVSSPKSGTIWLKALLFSITNRTRFSSNDHPILKSNPHELVPFLEMQTFVGPNIPDIENLPSPRLFATHIPFCSLPCSVKSSGCKIVYICRNPKDVLVSMWHFMSKLREKHLPPFSLQEAFDLFSQGISEFGPFWDHVKEYKEASLDCPQRVFFITYEEIRRDPLVNVTRLAEFVGYPLSFEEENEGVVEGVLKLCSFENLRNLEVNKVGIAIGTAKNSVYFREGRVGDWHNHLTNQMVECLDEITNEKLGDIFHDPLGSNCK